MASERNHDSDDDFHSVLPVDEDVAPRKDAVHEMQPSLEPPIHPIPAMQAAFEESINEAAECQERIRQAMAWKHSDSAPLKKAAQAKAERVARSQYHLMFKLVAQIVFGMHLLQQQQAKSNETVLKILRIHVNEVDSFLERSSRDLELSINDIRDRIRHLKTPMEHMEIFQSMLQDRPFQDELVKGNVKIEKIIRRTEKGMHRTMRGVDSGIEAVKTLGQFLNTVDGARAAAGKNDISDLLDAMRRNRRGWSQYLRKVHVQGNHLSRELGVLKSTLDDILYYVVKARRRATAPELPLRSAAGVRISSTAGLRSKFSRVSTDPAGEDRTLNKPLPPEPKDGHRVVQGTKTRPASKPRPVTVGAEPTGAGLSSITSHRKPKTAPGAKGSSQRQDSTVARCAPREPARHADRGEFYAQLSPMVDISQSQELSELQGKGYTSPSEGPGGGRDTAKSVARRRKGKKPPEIQTAIEGITTTPRLVPAKRFQSYPPADPPVGLTPHVSERSSWQAPPRTRTSLRFPVLTAYLPGNLPTSVESGFAFGRGGGRVPSSRRISAAPTDCSVPVVADPNAAPPAELDGAPIDSGYASSPEAEVFSFHPGDLGARAAAAVDGEILIPTAAQEYAQIQAELVDAPLSYRLRVFPKDLRAVTVLPPQNSTRVSPIEEDFSTRRSSDVVRKRLSWSMNMRSPLKRSLSIRNLFSNRGSQDTGTGSFQT